MNTIKICILFAIKLLIRNGNKLLITHDVFGAWDIPGGRIKKGEFKAKLTSVIERKVNEELGSDFKYSLGVPTVFFRVEREEHGLNNQKVRIFAVGYEALYLGGKIQLGNHHDKYEWVDIDKFEPDEYFVDGWLEGIKEYLDLQSADK